ncbi:hypothetical protein JQ038_16375 [Clostridium botulinum]|nr:hypothetical protein [Clostridium botulinum]MCS4483429.1 hypothetical protein [Clostridium botulinum]
MLSTVFGILTDVKFLFLKALSSMTVTFSPLIASGITISVSFPMYLVILPLENSKSVF